MARWHGIWDLNIALSTWTSWAWVLCVVPESSKLGYQSVLENLWALLSPFFFYRKKRGVGLGWYPIFYKFSLFSFQILPFLYDLVLNVMLVWYWFGFVRHLGKLGRWLVLLQIALMWVVPANKNYHLKPITFSGPCKPYFTMKVSLIHACIYRNYHVKSIILLVLNRSDFILKLSFIQTCITYE